MLATGFRLVLIGLAGLLASAAQAQLIARKDLSYAAARFLGFGGSDAGTAPVRLELLKDDPVLAQLVFPLNTAVVFPLTPSLVR